MLTLIAASIKSRNSPTSIGKPKRATFPQLINNGKMTPSVPAKAEPFTDCLNCTRRVSPATGVLNYMVRPPGSITPFTESVNSERVDDKFVAHRLGSLLQPA